MRIKANDHVYYERSSRNLSDHFTPGMIERAAVAHPEMAPCYNWHGPSWYFVFSSRKVNIG